MPIGDKGVLVAENFLLAGSSAVLAHLRIIVLANLRLLAISKQIIQVLLSRLRIKVEDNINTHATFGKILLGRYWCDSETSRGPPVPRSAPNINYNSEVRILKNHSICRI
jgi:hypothetical protein